MISNNISTHIFVNYPDTGKHLIDRISKIYTGKSIFLSLINGNPHNELLIETAKSYFDVNLIYVDNAGTDQYGFYHSFSYDNLDTDWIFYCHDKHPSKIDWLNNMIDTFEELTEDVLNNKKNGIIASKKHELKISSFDDLLEIESALASKYKKNIVEAMHTVVWYLQLQRILLSKFELGNKDFKYTNFSAGNFFLAKRDIIEKTHGCIYEEFFNKGVYRQDGEVEHGLERFYFYVSRCMGYNNIFK